MDHKLAVAIFTDWAKGGNHKRADWIATFRNGCRDWIKDKMPQATRTYHQGDNLRLMDYFTSEQAVLSACLRDESNLSSAIALERLTEEDFSSPAHSAIFRLIGSRSELNEIDVAIELPEYASDAIELAKSMAVDRWIGMWINWWIPGTKTRGTRLMESMDLLKQGKPTEEIAGKFNMQVARPCHRARAKCKREGGKGSILRVSLHRCRRLLRYPHKLPEVGLRAWRWIHTWAIVRIGARPGVRKSALAIHFSHEIAKRGYAWPMHLSKCQRVNVQDGYSPAIAGCPSAHEGSSSRPPQKIGGCHKEDAGMAHYFQG